MNGSPCSEYRSLFCRSPKVLWQCHHCHFWQRSEVQHPHAHLSCWGWLLTPEAIAHTPHGCTQQPDHRRQVLGKPTWIWRRKILTLMSGVLPASLSAISTLAFHSKSSWTMSECPRAQAKCKGVLQNIQPWFKCIDQVCSITLWKKKHSIEMEFKWGR